MVFLSSSLSAEAQTPKVVVVGAGLAGLTTAYRLHQSGVDVHLYEARNRVGGRVFTANVGGKIAELGGEGITDGGPAENICHLIEEFHLELAHSEFTLKHALISEEELIPMNSLLRAKQWDPDQLKDKLSSLAVSAQNLREVILGILDEKDPIYRVLAVRIAAYEGATVEKLSPYYTETLYQMLMGGISLVYQGDGREDSSIIRASIQGGNALLPEKMAEALGDRVHLGRPLTKIARGDDYCLTFEDGASVRADLLVLAIPCPVFKSIVFEEGVLPAERLETIEKVHYGTNAKVLIPLSAPPSHTMGLVSDRWVSFLDSDCHFLTLYYTGEFGRFSPKTLLHNCSSDWPLLEVGFGVDLPPVDALTYARDEAFSSYGSSVGYSWPNDPYAGGSYSYIAPGQETLLTDTQEVLGEQVRTLFAPVDEKLYFAGEHTSILFDVGGTMEAACESGERIARMILKKL